MEYNKIVDWKKVPMTELEIADLLKREEQRINIEEPKEKEEINKQIKEEQILKLATITDQINLMAWTLDIVVDELIKTNPELANNPWIKKSKATLNWIKTILWV